MKAFARWIDLVGLKLMVGYIKSTDSTEKMETANSRCMMVWLSFAWGSLCCLLILSGGNM